MGLCSAEITQEDVENQMMLDKKTKYQLIFAALLTSNVNLLSKPFILSENLQNGLVSLYKNVKEALSTLSIRKVYGRILSI